MGCVGTARLEVLHAYILTLGQPGPGGQSRPFICVSLAIHAPRPAHSAHSTYIGDPYDERTL